MLRRSGTNRRGSKAAALVILLAMGHMQPSWAEPFTVPLMRQPPTIDGLVEPEEWAAAHGFDGFVGADKVGVSTGLVVTENGQGQVRGYVGATDDAIHVAVLSRIPDGTPLKATFKLDTWEAVGDDSIEVFVNPTPEEEKRADYHRLFNSLGFGAYLVHDIGSADQTPPWLKPATWRGDWPMKQAVHDGWWHAEVTIPLASMPGVAPGRKATDGIWGVNLCRTWQKAPMTWSSLFGGYAKNTRSFRFTRDPAPAVQVSSDGLAGDPPVTVVMRVSNPSEAPLAVKASLSLRQSTAPDRSSADTFTLAAGEARQLRIKADDLATTSARLDAVVTSPDGKVAWYDRTTRWLPETKPLPVVDLSEETGRHVVIAPGTKNIYQGHPTTLLMPDCRTMFCVWTTGHGGPCGPLKRSDDGGLTWSDLLPVPENWKTTRNCPVLHRLTDPEGVTRLFVFAGQGPDGTRQPDNGIMHRSYSLDDGKTWSPMEGIGLECVMPFTSIVPVEGGKKLIGLANIRRPGDTKDPWSNIVVQSESTDGGLKWSPWRVLADLGRQKIGEPEVIRSPDGTHLLCLIRENVRTEPSHFITSSDEGTTWSAVHDLPPGLHGDRHQHVFLPDGRLVIAFRDMGRGSPTHDHFVAWVGRYEDIVNGRNGDYKIKLLHSHKGSDCGYPGLELLPDGTIVATTYVKYRPGPEQNSVVSVRFRIAETDAAAKKLAGDR